MSRASAEQRAGRAGRQAPGVCLRLWGEWEQAALPERETPEIAARRPRRSGAPAARLGGERPRRLRLVRGPDPAPLRRRRTLLRRLGPTDGTASRRRAADGPPAGAPAPGAAAARRAPPRLSRAGGAARRAARRARSLSGTARRPRAPSRASRSDLLDRSMPWSRRAPRDRPGVPDLNAGAGRVRPQGPRPAADMARPELGAGRGAAGRGGQRRSLLRALLAAYPGPRGAAPRAAQPAGRHGRRPRRPPRARRAPCSSPSSSSASTSRPERAAAQSEALVRLASEVEACVAARRAGRAARIDRLRC